MGRQLDIDPVHRLSQAKESIFAIHGDLDGEGQADFQERVQHIGLIVGGEEFLLPISSIHEIIMLPVITWVPNAPELIDGVINLRGTVLPAVNMRKLLGRERTSPTPATRIVVARSGNLTFGMIVDGITYVVALLPSEIEDQTLPGKDAGSELITAVAKHKDKIQGILDLGRVLRSVTGGDQPGSEGAAEVLEHPA